MSAAVMYRGPWTEVEDAVVRQGYGRESHAEIGAKIGRSANAVRSRIQVLALTTRSYEGLPAGPLAAAVRVWLRRNGVSRARVISDELLRSWEEPGATVRGDAADRWCCRMECLWFDVWDLDEPSAVAYFVGPAVEVSA